MSPYGVSRRVALLGALGLSGSVRAQSAAAALPLSRDLPAEGAAALRRGQALVVLVSLHGCVYCERVRRSYLLPLLAQGQAVVQIDMNSAAILVDFQQRTTAHEELVRRWQIKLAPTVLFLGPAGQELAERMEGAYQADFYGAYLEQRLTAASLRIAERARSQKK